MGRQQYILVPTEPAWNLVIVGYDPDVDSFYGFARGQRRPSEEWSHQWNPDTGDWDPQPSPDDEELFLDFGDPYTRILNPDHILDQAAEIAVVPVELRPRLLAGMVSVNGHDYFL